MVLEPSFTPFLNKSYPQIFTLVTYFHTRNLKADHVPFGTFWD